MRRFLLVIIALGIAAAAGSQGLFRPVSQEMIPLSSKVYEDMDALYRIKYAGTPSDSRPWTKTEANQILGRIDRASLGGGEIPLYDVIAEAIRPGLKFSFPDGFGFGADLDLFLEAYAHTNTSFNQESDWIRGFEDRKPMIRLSLDFSLKDFAYLYCDLQYGRNRFNIADDLYEVVSRYPKGIGAVIKPTDTLAMMSASSWIYSQSFLTNILDVPNDLDYQWPKRAVASIGGANWNLSLSRDKINWGNGHSGNFIVDDHVDYQDFTRLTAFSENFKYDWLNVFFDANTLHGEQPDTEFKILMAHRLEFRILKRLTFAISENVMYQNDVFDFRYLNPAFIYHNLNNMSMFNALAHVELDWNFAKGFNLYGQLAMDQARAPTEGTAQADAMGYLGGIEYAGIRGRGVFTSSLEFALTDSLLYRRNGVDFIMLRKYYTNGNPTGPGYIICLDYPGYEYGGDAIVLQWDGAYRIPGMGKLALRLFGMLHGEMNFFVSHNKNGDNSGFADYEGSTPSGDKVAGTLAASLSGEYEIPRLVSWAKARLWAEVDWINRQTYTKSSDSYSAWSSDLQATAGCSLSF
ncbi:MAG: hypothetical protein NT061_12930 [Spirochaetes bacterium]|nr:hypothetical protein [Spirochaetota bacterium]